MGSNVLSRRDACQRCSDHTCPPGSWACGGLLELCPKALRGMAGPRWNRFQTSCSVPYPVWSTDPALQAAAESGQFLLPILRRPLLTRAHLTEGDLALRLCRGGLSAYFCGGVSEARTEKTSANSKEITKTWSHSSPPRSWHNTASLLSSDSPSSDVSTRVVVVSVVQGWS